MRHLSFIKNIIILVLGLSAFILLIAEGEAWRQTVVIKTIACALIGVIVLIANNNNGQQTRDNSYGTR